MSYQFCLLSVVCCTESYDSTVVANHVDATLAAADNVSVSFTDESSAAQAVEVSQRPADYSATFNEPDNSLEPTVDTSAKNKKKKIGRV